MRHHNSAARSSRSAPAREIRGRPDPCWKFGSLFAKTVGKCRGTISPGAARLPAFIDADLGMMRVFGAYGLPLTVLIDDKGREVARAIGPADWDAPDAIAYFKALTSK